MQNCCAYSSGLSQLVYELLVQLVVMCRAKFSVFHGEPAASDFAAEVDAYGDGTIAPPAILRRCDTRGRGRLRQQQQGQGCGQE